MTENNTEKKNRAVLVGLSSRALAPEENADEASMEELSALLETAGGECVGVVTQSKDSPDPRTFIGEGKVAEVKELAHAMDADMVIFDNGLSPSQQRVLSEDLGVSVLDRSALILDIFAQRARTKEGRLQVELAQYKYLLPRLTGMWGHLVRQTASGGKSPIGTRGPGETQLETDRRHIRRKIAKLTEDLQEVRRIRAVQRDRREKNEVPVVAIVGYTNAGKSTLLNNLTRSEVLAENKLFATLDPTTRRLRFPAEREIILADTVGFIRNLPKELMDAFRATLEELESADLLVHVADASHPDLLQQITSVETILEELELQHMPRILLLNKWDLLDVPARAELADAFPHAIPISARTGDGLKRLLEVLENMLLSTQQSQLLIPFEEDGPVLQ